MSDRWLASTGTGLKTWLERPIVDVLVPAFAVGALLAGKRFLEWPVDALGAMAFEDRLGLYTDLIQIAGIFVAFSAGGLAAYLAFSGQHIERFRSIAHKQVMKQWISTIAGSAAAAAMLIVAKIGDRTTGHHWAHWVALAALLLIGAKALRMIYIFAQLAYIATQKPYERKRTDRAPNVRKIDRAS